MGITQGTTSAGTEVQVATDVREQAIVALDRQLISNLDKALQKAEHGAVMLVRDMGAVAGAILDLHQAETWKRTIDGVTGQPYSSAKAFYASLNRQDRFPTLHRVMRTELVSQLMDGDQLAGIGTNELAALIGCDAAQISRTVKSITAQAEPVTEDPETEAKLDEVAATFAAEALAQGKSEVEAEHAAEAARAAERDRLHAEAAAAAAEAKAKAEAEAEVKATAKAAKAFGNAVQGVRDRFHLMTAEQRAEVLKLVSELHDELSAFVALQAEGTPKARRNRGRAS